MTSNHPRPKRGKEILREGELHTFGKTVSGWLLLILWVLGSGGRGEEIADEKEPFNLGIRRLKRVKELYLQK